MNVILGALIFWAGMVFGLVCGYALWVMRPADLDPPPPWPVSRREDDPA